MELPQTTSALINMLSVSNIDGPTFNKFVKDFTKIAKPFTLLIRQQVKFECTPVHHEAFLKLKRFHNTGPNSTIPQPQQEIYSLHRHIG